MHLRTRIKNAMKTPWLYEGKEFDNDMIPKDAIGFVYEMQAIIDGKHVKYIGKKNFYSKRKKKFGKKALAAITDKRTKKYEVVTKLDYEKYPNLIPTTHASDSLPWTCQVRILVQVANQTSFSSISSSISGDLLRI